MIQSSRAAWSPGAGPAWSLPSLRRTARKAETAPIVAIARTTPAVGARWALVISSPVRGHRVSHGRGGAAGDGQRFRPSTQRFSAGCRALKVGAARFELATFRPPAGRPHVWMRPVGVPRVPILSGRRRSGHIGHSSRYQSGTTSKSGADRGPIRFSLRRADRGAGATQRLAPATSAFTRKGASRTNGPPSRRPVRTRLAVATRDYFSTRAKTTPMMRTLGAVCVMIPIHVLRNRFVG